MCEANLIGHWLRSAPDEEEASRRRRAVDALVRFRDGIGYIDGPELLRLIDEW
jgi:hypothetical protein